MAGKLGMKRLLWTQDELDTYAEAVRKAYHPEAKLVELHRAGQASFPEHRRRPMTTAISVLVREIIDGKQVKSHAMNVTVPPVPSLGQELGAEEQPRPKKKEKKVAAKKPTKGRRKVVEIPLSAIPAPAPRVKPAKKAVRVTKATAEGNNTREVALQMIRMALDLLEG